MVTKTDVVDVLKRLSTVYGMPLAAKRDKQAFEDEWVGVMRNANRDEVMRAVDGWIASDAEHWPKPGQLWGRIRRQRTPESNMGSNERAYRLWETKTWDAAVVVSPEGREDVAFTSCPICGAHPTLSPLQVVHVMHRHREANIPAIGMTDDILAYFGPLRERWQEEARLKAEVEAAQQAKRAAAKLELQRLLKKQLDRAAEIMA